MPVMGVLVAKREGREIAPNRLRDLALKLGDRVKRGAVLGRDEPSAKKTAYPLMGAPELGDERRESPPLVDDVLSPGAAEQPEGDTAADEAPERRSPQAARPRR
jgi:hypothetical protein